MVQAKVVLLMVFMMVAVVRPGAAGSDAADFTHGLHILGKLVRQYIIAQPEDLVIGDGVHLISTRNENDARASNDDGTVLGAFENYLQTHELRIKLPELMPSGGVGRAFKEAMESFKASSVGSPRGKGGKGGGLGGLLLLGLMMAKTLAAVGLGGVGLLAMKALMVSALALMLSMIIGLKKLVSSGHEEGHTVIHASGHGHEHHRKKREAGNIAYHAWSDYQTS